MYDRLPKCPETHSCRDEPLNNKCPHTNEEIALRKILAVKNATEQRNLVNLAHKIEYKYENQVRRGEMSLGNGRRRLYIGSKGVNDLVKTIIFHVIISSVGKLKPLAI
jgi:hypothetical protein